MWARPLKARPPRKSSSAPTASGSSTTGYSPGARSIGSSRETLAAARAASASGSSAAIAVPAPAAQPERPLSWRAMTFMYASVSASVGRTPVDEAMAVSTAPAVQTPKACSPAAAQRSKAVRSALPAPAGSSRAVAGSNPSCGRAGAGAGSPG